MSYDSNNVFARILQGEIPCKKVYEDAYALAFHDIAPQAAVHVVVVPKGGYSDHADFVGRASDTEIAGFERAVGKAAAGVGVAESGYRTLSNCGANAHQEVPHYHVHILGGEKLGSKLVKAK